MSIFRVIESFSVRNNVLRLPRGINSDTDFDINNRNDMHIYYFLRTNFQLAFRAYSHEQ